VDPETDYLEGLKGINECFDFHLLKHHPNLLALLESLLQDQDLRKKLELFLK